MEAADIERTDMTPAKRAEIRKEFAREFCKDAKLCRASPEDFAKAEREMEAIFPAAYVSFVKEIGFGAIPRLANLGTGMTVLSPLEAVATSRKAWATGMPRDLVAIAQYEGNDLLCFRKGQPGQRRTEEGLWTFSWNSERTGHAGHAGWTFDSLDECLQDYCDAVYERDDEGPRESL